MVVLGGWRFIRSEVPLHHARPFVGVYEKSMVEICCQLWAMNAQKWLQKRGNGSKNEAPTLIPPRRASRGHLDDPCAAQGGNQGAPTLQGYLAHKKHPPPRTLQ